MARYYVKWNAAGLNNGSSWTNAFTSLQSALAVASSGDDIWVAAGSYVPTNQVGGSGARYAAFQLINGVSIYGGFAGTETLLSQRDWFTNETILSGELGASGLGDNAYHVFYHPNTLALDETAVLDGFTISDGYADGSGPAGLGGGIYNNQCDPSILNCHITGNFSTGGGGIYNYESDPVIENTIIDQNTSDAMGGGIYNYHSSPTLRSVEISDNIGSPGAGMANYAASHPVTYNCTINGNTCALSTNNMGGGVYNNASILTAYNTIIYGNTADSGSDIYNDATSTASLINCCYDDSTDCIEEGNGFTTSECITSDPSFVSAVDRSLDSDSPCINAGNNDYADSADKDAINHPRISAGVVDMGAYEYQFVLSLTYVAGDNGSLTGDTSQTVNYGDSGTAVTAVPTAGYSFVSWDDGNTTNPRTDSNVTADKLVTALFVLDTVSVDELHDSREFENDASARLTFICRGSADEAEIMAAVRANAPASFENLQRDAINIIPQLVDINDDSICVWKAEVGYKQNKRSELDYNEEVITIDTTGGSQHISQSIETIRKLGTHDFNKAINYHDKVVDGLDIVAPVFNMTITKRMPASQFTNNYMATLFYLTATVNKDSFRGFAPGEVLFQGYSANRRGNEDCELSFRFACSPNARVNIPGLGDLEKKGWEYLWVQYVQDADTDGLIPKPEQASVEKVYEEKSWTAMGI